MKVLILSVDPWKQNNSFGNTYSSIFGKIDNLDIAHVYLLDGLPDFEKNISSYYQIPESEIIKSALRPHRRGNSVGREVLPDRRVEKAASRGENIKSMKNMYSKLLDFGKKHHWGIMFAARELAWKMGNVNYNGLFSFIDKFKPDLFLLAYYNVYNSNRIALKIKQHYDIPMVMVMMMDHYSLKRVSWNPIFWIDRFRKRAMIRKLVSESEKMFVISKKLKEEMERDLHIPCQVLYKTPDESRLYKPYNPSRNDIIKYLFTGNIYANRWKTLAMLAKELESQGGGKLDIYTSTPVSREMDKVLNIEGVSEIHVPVSQNEVIALQNNADVLVHAEAFDKYNKSLVRCAISTKIMDYLSVGRCILAIGPSDISSVEYLTDNNLALVASDEKQLGNLVRHIKANRAILGNYAAKGREYATKELDANKMRKALFEDLQRIIDKYN